MHTPRHLLVAVAASTIAAGFLGVVVVRTRAAKASREAEAKSAMTPPNAATSPGTSVRSAKSEDAELADALARCRNYSDPGSSSPDWGLAKDWCIRVLEKDPANAEASWLGENAVHEAAIQRLLTNAQQLAGSGKYEEALDSYLEIDPYSHYFDQASSEIPRVRQKAVPHALDQCNGGKPDEACATAAACTKYLDYVCWLPRRGADYTRILLKRDLTNSACNRPVGWKCPERTRRLDDYGRSEGYLASFERTKKRLDAAYCRPDLVKVLLGYWSKGEPQGAVAGLKELGQFPPRCPSPQTVADAIHDLETVDSASRAALAAAGSDPKTAARRFWEAFDADSRVMAGDASAAVGQLGGDLAMALVASDPVASVGRFTEALDVNARPLAQERKAALQWQLNRKLADRLAEKGRALLNNGDMLGAAGLLFKASELAPSNSEVTASLLQLERAADNLMNQGCQNLAIAQRLVRPASSKMRLIRERQTRMHCP